MTKIYKTRLKTKYHIAENTLVFEFEKPKNFKYLPGQFTRIFLGENFKTFSIASAPYEKYLLFAMRQGRSDFKKSLANLLVEDVVRIERARGKFTLHKNETIPAVFLVGGIGITPVRSIILDAQNRRLKHKFYLFFSNKNPKNAPFLQQMQNIELLNYRFVATMTDIKKSKKDWAGERGYINSGMIRKYIKEINLPIYYIVGPPIFVKDMVKLLEGLDISQSKIKREMFGGY